MVCGIATPASSCSGPGPSPGGDGDAVGPKLLNVLATRHVNNGGDACALPKVNYNIWNPFALGNVNELDYLKFDSGTCNSFERKEPYPSNDAIDISSKELGFLNLRSQLNSTVVTYSPMQLKNREDR